MADERIDIQVTDKVDAGIAKKLNQIADAADRGENYIKRLQAAVASVNASALDRLANAMAKADSAQARLISAQARLTNAQIAGSAAADKAALAQQRIATESARTEAAQARAAGAAATAALAQQRLAGAQQGLTGASNAAATAQQGLGNATTQAGTAAAGAGNQWRAYIASMSGANAQARAATAAAGQVGVGMNGTANAHMNYQRAARQTTAVNANIIAQMQDIGVSLAGGQNPLLVFIQQGSQLSYIASTMDGGMKALLLTIGRMALAWAPVIAAVGAAYFAFSSFTQKINDSAGIKDYVKTLGLTHAELKKLGDQHVTMGDTIKATWQVLSENLLATMGFSTEQIKSFWNDAMNTILKWAVAAFLGIGAGARVLIKVLVAVIGNIPKIFYNAGVGAANLFMMGIQALVNGVADAMNAIGGFINKLSNKAGLGNLVGTFNHINLGVKGVTQGMMELNNVDIKGEWNQGLENGLSTLKRIGKQSAQNARDRLKQRADELKADRNPRTRTGPKPKVDHTAENRAHALDMVNLKLDDELARMKMLKDAREVQQRMDQIEEQLAQKKIVLSDKEKASILAKVQAIQAYKYVQAEMDRIYEKVNAPLRTYQASLQAVNDLLAQNAISTQQAAQENVLAARAYQEATDPLFKMKEAMDAAEVAAKLYGDQVQQQSYYESIRQEYLKQGIILDQQWTQGQNAAVDALMRRNAALQQQQFVQQQVQGIIDPLLQDQKMLDNKAALYAEIDRLRQNDVLSEQNAQRAKYALDAKFAEMRLQGASQFFGTLAQLSSSGNKKLAMIGKAAAIAQATIDGFLAVQKALASSPPPWNMLQAGAIAVMTGMNVARIVSTPVGNFATGGQFMVDGKSGIDANNINMNVTRGERVTIETPAQQRANDAGGGAPNVNVPIKLINVSDRSEMANYLSSSEGERVILNVIRNNPQTVAGAAGAAR